MTSVESTSGSRIYTYTSDGSIASTLDQNDSLTEYDYDAQGRLSAVHEGDGSPSHLISYSSNVTSIQTHETSAEFEFEMEQGHLVSLTDEDGLIEIERNKQGYIIGLQDAEQRAYFERDELQQVVATHYPSGFVSRYAYDALGNRNWVLHSTGSSVHYRHDSAGNIIEVTVSDGDGRFKRQKVEIGEMNQVHRVIYDGDRGLSAHYDAQSRPIRLEVGTDTISIDYGPRGDSMRMVSKNSGKEWQGDVPIPRAHDMGDRAKVLKRSNVNQSQPGHRVLHFNEWTFEVEFVDPLFLELRGLNEAQAILSVANELIRSDALASATSFEKPSNPIFQPFEYRSTNCCIPCSINVCQECTVGGRRASWWLCFCQSETLWHSYGPSGGDPEAEQPIQEILDIMQEYVEEKQPAPAYEDFTNSASTEHFTSSEYNSGNYEYFVAKKMLEIAETVRAKYNEKIDDDPNTDYSLVIESGYRNPKRNKEIGGKETSKHMYGDAIDLRVPQDNMPANWTVKTAGDFLFTVADSLYGEDNSEYYLYLNGNVVHIEYDP